MFDLALTPTGDLIFQKEKDPVARLNISFAITTTQAIKIRFDTEDFSDLQPTSRALSVSFDIKDLEHNKEALVLTGANAKEQAIRIRLLTVFNEIEGRPNAGSRLDLVKHRSFQEKDITLTIMSLVKEAISDILVNPEVKVSPYIDKTNGYTQSMRVYIYEEGLLIFKHELKG